MNDIKNNKIIPEEYNSEFSFAENKSGLNISFERIAFIFFVFFIIAIIFSLKVIFLSQKNKNEVKKLYKKDNFRSSILDKDGNILAKTVPIKNIKPFAIVLLKIDNINMKNDIKNGDIKDKYLNKFVAVIVIGCIF